MSSTNFQLFQFIMLKVIFCRNKVFVYSHFDFGLKFDFTKVYGGPVGNRHVKITLHVISLLHIHIIIHVI